MMGSKTAQALWQDYHFLTKEMKKFSIRRNMELFYELMDQRERLQKMIDQIPEGQFKATPEGERLLREIQQDNKIINDNLQVQMNKAKQSHQVAEIYTGINPSQIGRMNLKG